jgi:hypothetical protein
MSPYAHAHAAFSLRDLPMSDSPNFSPRWFTVKLTVYPPIPMVDETAYGLAARLGGPLSLTDIHIGDELWEYRRPHKTAGQPRGLIRLLVEENEIRIEHQFPATGLEQFERLAQTVLNSFEGDDEQTSIRPLMTFISVELDYVVNLRQDSRDALLCGLSLKTNDEDEPNRIDSFERPCYLVGLRLGFPPFRQRAQTPEADEGELQPEDAGAGVTHIADPGASDELAVGADWEAQVTLLTLEDDPSKASIEIAGRWMRPVKWSEIKDEIANKLEVAEKFLRQHVVNFLDHFIAGDESDDG